MDRELKILLVEDDSYECEAIIEYVKTLEGVRIVGTTDDTNQALLIVKDCLPDAVILDLELHKGYGNGFIFLEELNKLELNIFPYILVTTHNTSQTTHDQLRKMGADFILSKYQRDYNEETAVKFLCRMDESIKNRINLKIKYELMTSETAEQQAARVQKKIDAYLELIGINPKLLGKKYLAEGIRILINGKVNYLCGEIAKKFRKSDKSVERAMQGAINNAWRTGDIDELSKYYTAHISSERGVPTLNEFIYYYADKIRKEL